MGKQREQVESESAVSLPPLPSGWAWSRVDEVGEVKLGRQRSPEHHSGTHMRPYLRVANVYDDRIDISDVLKMNFTPQEYETYALMYGDILLNEGQSIELVGRPAMYRDEVPGCCFQNTLIRFRAREGVLPEYALMIFRHYVRCQRFQKIAKWTVNIAHLGTGRFAEVEFPLPPTNEQRRIVQKASELFSQIDAGVVALKRVQIALKRYRAAVLKAAVEGKLTEEWRAAHPDAEPASALLQRILGERRRLWEEEQQKKYRAASKEPPKGWREKYAEPAGPDVSQLPALPAGWCWGTVAQLTHYLRNGLSQKPTSEPPGYRILRINAVRPMQVDLSEVRYLREKPADEDGYLIQNGDLLITRYNGSRDLLGVVGMVRICDEPTLHPDKLIRVKAVLGTPLPAFIELAGNVGASRRHMEGRARTTAGQTGISGQDIREMPIPVPSLDEQQEIIAQVDEKLSVIDKLDAQVEMNLKRAVRLRQSILKTAFEGRLVPQDPADEPAEALLGRIRQQRASGSTRRTTGSTKASTRNKPERE